MILWKNVFIPTVGERNNTRANTNAMWLKLTFIKKQFSDNHLAVNMIANIAGSIIIVVVGLL